jgi:hypothetical protein
MEQVYPTTPFERRTLSLAILASRMVGMGCLPTTAVRRSHVLNSIRGAMAAHGLSNRMLVGLNDLSISDNSTTLVVRRRRQATREIFRMTKLIRVGANHMNSRDPETRRADPQSTRGTY